MNLFPSDACIRFNPIYSRIWRQMIYVFQDRYGQGKSFSSSRKRKFAKKYPPQLTAFTMIAIIFLPCNFLPYSFHPCCCMFFTLCLRGKIHNHDHHLYFAVQTKTLSHTSANFKTHASNFTQFLHARIKFVFNLSLYDFGGST